LLSHTTPHGMQIFDAPFLLQDDEVWFGKKPFRTYYGAKYIGGFSDHLPVYSDFSFWTIDFQHVTQKTTNLTLL